MSTAATRRELLEEVSRVAIARRGDGVLKVAVDGVDAAGKTIFADELGEVLAAQGANVVRVSIDDFHNPAATRLLRDRASGAFSYYEDSFNYEAFWALVLDPLSTSGSGRIRPKFFDHRADKPVAVAPVQVADGSILVVDGIFLGRPELSEAWDLWIFLHVSQGVARSRVVARDLEHLGSGAAAAKRYRLRYEPGQRLYLESAEPTSNADLVIDNNDLDAPVLVRVPEDW